MATCIASWEKERYETAQSEMNSAINNFEGPKCSEHHMESCSYECEHFLQKKIASIKAADVILKIRRDDTKSVPVKKSEVSENVCSSIIRLFWLIQLLGNILQAV